VTLLVLFILAVIWLAVLLPPWLQNRGASRSADSITTFRHQLSVLERRAGSVAPHRVAAGSPNVRQMYAYGTPLRPGVGAPSPRASVAPPPAVRMSAADAHRRRRDIFNTLAGAALITLVLAVFIGGPVWVLLGIVTAVFASYALMMKRVEHQVADRASKLRYLPRRQQGRAEPAYLLRRSAN
jgi:hypothetical protein